jgi:hypothetical protein
MNTKAEVESSPIFRIVKKATMRKYPWIKDMYIGSDEDIKKYQSMMFIDINIDAQQLAEERGWTLESWVNPDLQRRGFGRNYAHSVYLSIMYKPENSTEAMALQTEVDNEIKRIQNSASIPDEYKISKTFGISDIKYFFPTQPDNTTITN